MPDGPLIHLDEVGCLDLLSDFSDVLVAEAVWQEVRQHRPGALNRGQLRIAFDVVSRSRSQCLTRRREGAKEVREARQY